MDKLLLKNIVEKPQSGEWGKEDETGDGIPVLRTTNFTNTGEVDYSDIVTRVIDPKKIEKKVLLYGDIIIEKSGGSEKQPVGRVIFFEGEDNKYLFNNFTSVLRVKNNVSIYNKYLFYYLFSFYKKGGTLKFQNKTTGLHNLKLGDMLDGVQVPQVDIDVQHKIVDVLDNLYKCIKLRQQQLEELDTLIKSRFVEMFGDPKELDSSWKKVPLGELCTIVRGGSPRPINKFLGGTIPWIKIGDATQGDDIYLHSTKEHIIEEGIKKSRYIREGSMIFANCGVSLGFARIITFKGCIHDGWLAFEDIDARLDKIFLLKSLNMCTDYFRRTAPDGTQPNLNTTIMKSYMQIVPPIDKQKEYVQFCEHTDKLKVEVKKSLNEAEVLFNMLMQDYFE